jgi:hypothetical protein
VYKQFSVPSVTYVVKYAVESVCFCVSVCVSVSGGGGLSIDVCRILSSGISLVKTR